MKRDIKTVNDINGLIEYFVSTLNWKIDLDYFENIEDITYDFDAEDIGLKEEAFAKIKTLRQLRPLVDGQRWGIFCVEFDSRKFEITALRKILSGLIPTKRNSAEHAVWDQKDLLFLCFWGEGDNRTIGIAHFEDKETGLPQIKIIYCAPAHEDFTNIRVFEERLKSLKWPEEFVDHDRWQEVWSSAFKTAYRQTINDVSTLTAQLAVEAQGIRNRILSILDVETRNGYVHLLYNKFKDTLIHDMTEIQFADMYAQTVVYGLFSARCMDETQEDFSAEEAVECIPCTNPFLKSLMKECLGSQNRKLSFDELEIGNVVDLLLNTKTDAIIQDFNRQTGGGREDPVIHFYEEFLEEYDKTQRVQRGVYYTPQPVVNFIVRAVDYIIKTEFGFEDGLASTATKRITYYRDSKKKKDGRYTQVKDTKDVPAIQVLDPATGTGTFIRQTILQIYENFKAKNKSLNASEVKKEWNNYVPKHLLPRLNAFELMMAPYAVAHMKLAMVLKDTGYEFESDERLNIYLTNTLEEPGNSNMQITMFDDPLASESVAANAVKKNDGINVVIGNPPYSNSSSNRGEWIQDLITLYKDGLNERKLNLDEDSIKFIRYGHFLSEKSDENYVLSYISNNSFINGVTHRKMRSELMKSFDKIFILNLHGDSNRIEKAPDGSKDENVFDIQQGVSINTFVKVDNGSPDACEVYYADLFGLQNDKLRYLHNTKFEAISWEKINPVEPYFFFDNKDFSETATYENGFSVAELFLEKNTGIQTKNDALTLQTKKEKIEKIAKDFVTLSVSEIEKKYGIKPGGTWTVSNAKADLMRKDYTIIPVLFRPFDIRYTILTDKSSGFLGRPRFSTMKHMVCGFDNYALLVGRQNKSSSIDSFLVTDMASEMKCAERTIQSYHMPIFVGENDIATNRVVPKANFDAKVVGAFCQRINKDFEWSNVGSDEKITALDLLAYIYAYLYSNKYRSKFENQLKIDFPRIPYPDNYEFFLALKKLGWKLIEVHLMRSPVDVSHIHIEEGESLIVDAPKYSNGIVNINKAGTRIVGIDKKIWKMGMGGYAPLQKWLKDRRGWDLRREDLEHLCDTAARLEVTLNIMEEIDRLIKI